MSGESIRPQRESLGNILERAIKEAEAARGAKDTSDQKGEVDADKTIREFVRLAEEGVANGSDVVAERQVLRTLLRGCDVNWVTADLLTHAVFAKLETSRPKDTSFTGKAKELFGHAKDVFKNQGGS